jgi:probable rRNA maturation factor
MIVDVDNKQDSLEISEEFIRKVVSEVLDTEGCVCNEVALYFVDVKEISNLHEQFFDDPSPTDCISFPMDDDEILGEVFVCPQVAIEYAQEHSLDPHQEMTLYVVHGLLHLLGYDDIEEKDIVVMRQAEQRHMQNLFGEKC